MTSPNNLLDQPILPVVIINANIDLKPFEIKLLQSAHPGYEKIIVEQEFGGGFSGTRVFLVLPVKPNGAKDAKIVTKLGPASELLQEKENYEHYAGPALPFTATQIRRYIHQDGQAALNYVFAGGDSIGDTSSLEDYYAAHTAIEINKMLDILLDKALGKTWYGQNQPLHSLFNTEYGRHLPQLEKLREIVTIVFPDLLFLKDNGIKIPGVDHTYPDPLKMYQLQLNKILEGRRSFVHGDLHLRNVLVDQSGKGWLIDFAKVNERHNLFDFIKLEIYIRLMVLGKIAGAFSWNEYAQFELVLNAASVGQKLKPPVNPHLEKAWQVIRHIRQIAHKYMGAEPNFKDEYFPALLLYGLAMLKYYSTNGPAPTQLVFIMTCSLAAHILEETNSMGPISSDEDKNTKKAAARPSKTAPTGAGGVYVGGDAKGALIVSGNKNSVNQTNRHINTGGGSYFEGNVKVENGDLVGRDKTTHHNTPSVDEIAKAFATILQVVDREKDIARKEKAQKFVQKMEAEARKGDEADEDNIESWFTVLAKTSADVWDVAVATLANPIAGVGMVFQKIAKRARDEQD